jgi:geranylgeranyl diphosphate synthase type II
VGSGCAFVPVGLPEEDIPSATARLLALRERGYHALVPRAFVPLPNTGEWQRMEERFPPRVRDVKGLDGSCLPFTLPEYGAAEGPELFTLWCRDNRWPEPLPTATAPRRRSVSFREVRGALDAYLADAPGRVTDCHAHDAMGELLDALAPLEPGLTPIEGYPFAAWQGRSLLELVQEAIELRLRSLGSIPEPLVRTIQHAALAGGKRIRPILVLTIACAKGVPLRAAMPAALATEWIHTASLIQDDLPCMDDDAIRRRDVSAHVRHGEGLALLASDGLMALAFEDVAALGALPEVGPARALELTLQIAQTLGVSGLVGGQVRDLLTRSAPSLTLQDVLEVHRHKTAPLFRLTAGLASTLAGLEAPLSSKLEEMLASLGLAFQIIDDVLDATPGNESFGRPAGSDSRNHVPTFATLLGIPAARRYADQLLAPYRGLSREQPGLFGLTSLARYVLERHQ